ADFRDVLCGAACLSLYSCPYSCPCAAPVAIRSCTASDSLPLGRNPLAAPLFRERPLHTALMRKTGRAGALFVGWKSASAKAANGRRSSTATHVPQSSKGSWKRPGVVEGVETPLAVALRVVGSLRSPRTAQMRSPS